MIILTIYILVFTIGFPINCLQFTLKRNEHIFSRPIPDDSQIWDNNTLVGIFLRPEKLVNFLDLMHYSKIAIGTPSQRFKVIFDTGMSDIFLASSRCITGCETKHLYDRTLSTTYHRNGTFFSVLYQGGFFNGILSSDTVDLNGTKVENQTFCEVQVIRSRSGSLLPFDGVVGLGFRELSVDNSPTLIENLSKKNILNNLTFSIYKENQNSVNKVLLFGNYAGSHFKGKVTYVKLGKQPLWQFRLDNVTVQGNPLVFCLGGCIGFANTGSPFIHGPASQIDSLNLALGAIKGSKYSSFNCDNSATKTVKFGLGGEIFVITPTDFTLHIKFSDGSQMCVSAFVPSDEPIWDLGMPFIGSVFTIFDFGIGRIGFAKNQWDE